MVIYFIPPEVTPGQSRKMSFGSPNLGPSLNISKFFFFTQIWGVYPERRGPRAGCDFTELDPLKREPRSTVTFPAHLTANPRRNIYRKGGWNRPRPAPDCLKIVGAGGEFYAGF